MHILIVGGTGMLRALIEQYANAGYVLTLLARDRKKLNEFKAISSSNINIIAVDYVNSETAIIKVQEVLKQSVKIGLAILWIHSTGNAFRIKLKELLISANPVVKIFELVGSGNSNPISNNTDNLNKLSSENYRKIILGHEYSNNKFRWLTDEEICEGTLYAIEKDKLSHVIGELKDEG